MNCKYCGQEINTIDIDIDCQKIDVCADEYDVLEEAWPFVLQPKSGRRKVKYVAGKTNYTANPCRCPQSEETFGKWQKEWLRKNTK